MNNNSIFIIVYLFFVQFGYAQDFLPLANTKLHDYAVHSESLVNGNVLILHEQYPNYWITYETLDFEELLEVLPLIDYSFGRLTMYNKHMELLKTMHFILL